MLQSRDKLAMIVAEFLGTGVLTITALAVLANLSNPIFVALGLGVAMSALFMIFGRVSGAHFNPAITLAMLTTRRVSLLPAIVYIAAQLLGGIVGYALYMYLFDRSITSNSNFDSRVLVSEAVGAFVFALGWAAAIYNRYNTAKTAFVLGSSLTVGVLVASFVGTGIVNPALALGMHSWVWSTFVLGPVLGAVIAFNLYALLFAPAKSLATGDVPLDADEPATLPSDVDEDDELVVEEETVARTKAVRRGSKSRRKK